MQTIVRALLLAVPLFLVQADRTQAQNYPWCADGYKGGARSCGFSTFEQCLATVSGSGGFCERNPMYRPDDSHPVRPKSRR